MLHLYQLNINILQLIYIHGNRLDLLGMSIGIFCGGGRMRLLLGRFWGGTSGIMGRCGGCILFLVVWWVSLPIISFIFNYRNNLPMIPIEQNLSRYYTKTTKKLSLSTYFS